MIEQYNLLIILVTVVCCSIGAIVVTRNFTRTSPISNKIKKQYDVYISDLELSNKRLRGQISHHQKEISISAEDAGDPLGAISAVLDQIAPQLPAAIRPLLKNKNAISFIENYVKSNPEAIKGIVEKLVSKQKPGDPGKAPDPSQESTL
tara:strand:- start:381 stop:827 length:447 start_codon:yes stop_codon:yes gene_type:complete